MSLLAIRANSVEKSRRAQMMRAAQRLALDLAGQIESGALGEPEIGRVEAGVFVDNRKRLRDPGQYAISRVEYPAYPDNENEPSYPPGLKFEWEITEDGQPAEEIPMDKGLNSKSVVDRYDERHRLADDRERELSYRDGGEAPGLPGEGALPEEELDEEEKTEEWRTLTIFVRRDSPDPEQPLELLFELERRFLWTYPDRVTEDDLDDLEMNPGGPAGAGGGGQR